MHPTEIVLAEALHLLGGNSAAAHALLSLVRGGSIVLHQIWPEALRRTQELMLKHEVMNAADASMSVCLQNASPKPPESPPIQDTSAPTADPTITALLLALPD